MDREEKAKLDNVVVAIIKREEKDSLYYYREVMPCPRPVILQDAPTCYKSDIKLTEHEIRLSLARLIRRGIIEGERSLGVYSYQTKKIRKSGGNAE